MEPRDTRERILQAALEEFADKGKDGARMQGIADRAEVNKALLHYYFRSKDELYHEVIRDFLSQVLENITHVQPNPADMEGTIKAVIDAYMGMIHENPKFPRIMLRQMLDGESLDTFFDKIFPAEGIVPLRDNALATIQTLQSRGVLRDVDPRACLLMLLGSMVFYFVGLPLAQFNWPSLKEDEATFFENYKATIATVLTHGLLKEGIHS